MQHLRILIVIAACLAATTATALPDYTGYSGAPGSRGICAGDCHGSTGGTITVSGFPSNYAAGQSYVITVEHNGGSSICNFNASVRIGTGSLTAGTLTAGTGTEVYNATGEPMGVHLSSNNRSSGTFTWTAPNPPVGPVKLYLAGHQGSSSGGPNTEIQLTAQGAGIGEAGNVPKLHAALRVEPNVAASRLVLSVNNPQAPALIRIAHQSGRVVNRLTLAPNRDGNVIVVPLVDREGRPLAAGTYFASMTCAGEREVRKFTVR